MINTKRELLESWVSNSSSVIAEFSSNINQDYRDLVKEAKHIASWLLVPWDDEIIPEHIREALDI